jgi:protein-L-isoaspartate(D-aspartate) O-methyltransferase
MDQAEPDFAAARDCMVDSQVRPNKVYDPRILTAMRRIPREDFVPADKVSSAYLDDDVILPGGRALMEPMVIARLLQACAVVPGEQALVVAAGTGYGAALLAACGASVTALEEDPALIAIAKAALAAWAPGVTIVTGALDAGWPAGAPYDLILVDGAVGRFPPALAAQLRPRTGRIVGVLQDRAGTGHAVMAEATPSGLRPQPLFDCNIPLIPSLAPVAGFVF